METWLAVLIGVVGIALLLAIPAALWTLVIQGLVYSIREKRGKDQPDQPKPAH